MLLAPQPTLSAVSRFYASGLRGVRQTLAVMRQMVGAARIDPQLRQLATTLVFNTPEKNEYAEVSALLAFVQSNVRYVKDVLDVETLSSPQKTLAGRIGDCDDQTTLLAALLESVGYPTCFVVAGYSQPNVLEHVYLAASVDGQWLACDPTERGPVGWEPPDALCYMYERK